MPRNRNAIRALRLEDLDDRPLMPLPDHADYEIEVKPVPSSPHEPEQWYWHLYYRDTKINGGIADYEAQARERARDYKFDHHRDVWLKHNFWDKDDYRWRSREVL